jgi:hypothetical protein
MAIKIIKTADVHLTATQLARYRYEYQRAFSMYCGPLPDFEEWVAKQERQKKISRADPETGQPNDSYGD